MGDRFWKFFHEIYESLPRQGPGDRASTERALAMLPTLTSEQRILDVGCGSGAQTLDLARACAARIVAVDIHEPFIRDLERRLEQAGLADRVQSQVADMAALPFADETFDVVWSEGAIFVIGFAAGLAAWKPLLRPGGFLVVSELCWLTKARVRELEDFFLSEGGDIGSIDERREAIAGTGYELVGDFVLPPTGWWDNYYVPLAAALTDFRLRYAGNDEALEVAARSQAEIEIYRQHPDAFGYGFFVMRRSN